MKIKPIGDKQLLVLHNSKLFRFKESTVLKIDLTCNRMWNCKGVNLLKTASESE